ncbi:unnamed protein product [Brassica oleracea var. botrytis]|uniref:(rape) hypothetical protein n=1 Tax=Brassica napus TaxID=3708 RepID=A0A816M3W9_BRANA|nr:unnamed protein product [Brassica napus]
MKKPPPFFLKQPRSRDPLRFYPYATIYFRYVDVDRINPLIREKTSIPHNNTNRRRDLLIPIHSDPKNLNNPSSLNRKIKIAIAVACRHDMAELICVLKLFI